MKTKSLIQNIFSKKLLLALALFLCIGLLNTASACTANFTYSLGLNGHVNFTNTSTGYSPHAIYTWDPGDASGAMYGQTPNHIYIANNTYNVKLVVKDSFACADSITIPVSITNVTTPCTLSANFTETVGANGSVKFTSTSTGTNAHTLYFWNFNDGSPRTQGLDTITHIYTYTGWYNVWLTIEDTGSAYCYDSIPMYINVNTSDSNICTMLHPAFTYTVNANGHAVFTSTSLGARGNAIYTWNPGNGNPEFSTASVTYANYTYTVNGTYSVTLAILQNDSANCSDSITMPITVSNVSSEPCNLDANFTITYDSSGQVTFTNTSPGTYPNTEYFWDPGDGTGTVSGSSTFVHQYSFINSYNATLTLVNPGADSCVSIITLPLYIYNKDSLQASFTYLLDSLSSNEYFFTSTSLGTNANTYYKWDAGDGSPADSGLGMTTYTHTYAANGPYSATLTIWYTVLPLRLINPDGRVESTHFDESSYTLVLNVGPAGIASIKDPTGNLNLYPNPSNGQFKLSLSNMSQNQNAEIDITNVLGELVYKSNTETTNTSFTKEITLQSSPGLYFVRVITANKVYTTKLVIGSK